MIGAVAWFWFFNQTSNSIVNTNESLPNNNQPLVNNENLPPVNPPINTIPLVDRDEQQLKTLARLFTERFGSYSTDARFQNLKELDYLYTPGMKASVAGIISSSSQNIGYYSVTTRALAAEILYRSEDSATVMVNTQRQEVFVLGGDAQLTYQTLRLQFNKINGQWKVDSAKWE